MAKKDVTQTNLGPILGSLPTSPYSPRAVPLVPDAIRLGGMQRELDAQASIPSAGFLEVTKTALGDSSIMSWGLIRNIFDPVDDEDRASIANGYSYVNVMEEVEKGASWEEVEYLRENGVKGMASLRRAQENNLLRREDAQVYARASAPTLFLGQLAAGMMDPTAAIVGLGVAGLTAKTAIGAGALVRAGRPIAATSAVIGENIAGELLFTALQDYSGEVLGAGDYAMAAAGAAVFSGGMEVVTTALGRGTYRAAQARQALDEAERWAKDMQNTERQQMEVDGVEQFNDDAVSLWRQKQATEAVTIVNTRTETPVIPTELQQQIRDDAEGTGADDAEGEAPKVETPKTPEEVEATQQKVEEKAIEVLEEPEVADFALTPDRVLETVKAFDDADSPADGTQLLKDYLDSLDDPEADAPQALAEYKRRTEKPVEPVDPDGPIQATRDKGTLILNLYPLTKKSVTMDGREILPISTIKRRATKDGTGWKDTTLGDMLRAASQSQNQHMRALKPMIDLMITRMGDGAKVPVTLAYNPFGYSEDAGRIISPTTDEYGMPLAVARMTEQKIVDSMGWHASATLVHEIAHALTQHILRASEDTVSRRKLSPEVLRAVETIEDVLARYSREVELLPASQQMGLRYAMNNVHELVAEASSSKYVQQFLYNMPASKAAGGRFSNALQELVAAVKRLFGESPEGDNNAYNELMHAVDTLFRARGTAQIRGIGGERLVGWPGAEMPRGPLPGVMPDVLARQPQWEKWSWLAKHAQEVNSNLANHDLVNDLTRGVHKTPQEVGALDSGVSVFGEFATNKRWKPVVDALKQLQETYLPDSHLILSDILDRTKEGRNVNGQILTVGENHVIGVNARMLGNNEQIIRTLVHEVGHAVFHRYAKDIPPEILARMKSDFGHFVQQVYDGDPKAVNARFSVTSMNRGLLKDKAMKSSDYNLSFDEFSAEQFVKFIESRTAGRKEGGLVGEARDYLVSLMKEMIRFFKGTQNAGMLSPTKGFDDFFTEVLQATERSVGLAAGPTPVNPIATVAARQKFSERMYRHAESFMRQNPIDVARLRVLTAKFGGALSDGLRLARSNNPILQMVASLVTETTTGAAGRKANVAIRKETLKMRLIGNSRLDFETAYADWKNRNNVSVVDDLISGEARRKFDRLVYVEILSRKMASEWRSADPAVAKAADALEALFERSLKAQKEADTLGAARLPDNSRGYIPQSLDGRKLAEADPQDLIELQDHLALHWEANIQWDARFAKQFAAFYVNRARTRVMNPNSKDFSGASADGVSILRDSLEEMAAQVRDPAIRADAIKAKRGLGQTKKRLDVGLLDELPSGKKVLDFYEDDAMALSLRYVNRTAGTVALTEFGIPGMDGIKHLRDAAIMHADNKADIPTKEELEAFDRVMAEIMGQPVPGEVHSNPATGIRMFVMLQRLGSMVYTQAAETVNMVHHLGIGATLKGVASLPRMLGEVGRVKRGQDPRNHILTDIEQWGGEFGGHQYKMVFPLDPPDARLETYVDDPGLLHRLLSAGAYYQSKITGFRALMAAQHRMVAEQIVMKAARYLKDGASADRWLRDMGIDEELAGHIRLDLHNVAQWDAKGNLTKFDVTQIQNPQAAEAFVQAIHRGVNQIIQGTFVGERNAWAHNDWTKVFTQLRTFGLTSTEKQWARVREVTGGGKQGYAAATGLLLAQIAMVMPIIAARVHMASIGREDREEFIEKNLSPTALVRASLNYAALSGMFGDVLDLIGGLAGSVLDDEQKELVGGRQGQGAGKITDAVPALGSADALAKVATGNSTVYNALKQLPFSNTPYLIPLINLFK